MPRKKEVFDAMRETTRNRIDEAALSLFARKGLSVTVDEIAGAAGISKGLLYNHYPSKDALIIELVRRADEVSSRSIGALAHNSMETAEKIRRMTAMMLQMFSGSLVGINSFMFMMQIGMCGFAVPPEVRYSADLPNPIDSLAEMIVQGQEEGTVISGDALELSTAYWAAIQGLCCYAMVGITNMPDSRILNRILLKEEETYE